MSLRFPTFYLRCTLEYAAKSANHLSSRAHHPLYPLQNNDNNSNSVDLKLLAQLQQHGFSSHTTPYLLNKLMSSCAKSSSLYIGIQLHSTVIKMGFQSNMYISSALVDMYSKCGQTPCAHLLFDEMPQRNVVTWNSLISGYLHTQYPEFSIELFMQMLEIGIAPTPFSVSAVLVGCAQLEAGELGAQVHSLSLKAGFCFNVVVGTSLIDMYSKCSNVNNSRRVFDHMFDKNVVTWTSMVTGYAQNDKPYEAMILVREMLRSGIRSNYVTYNSLLSSFCYSNDLDHCKQMHCRIIQEGLESNAYLAVTLVTIYSACSSSLKEFYRICSGLTVWDQISWNAVIAGFTNLGNGEEAFIYFSKMRRAGIDADFFTFASILKAMGVISAHEQGKQTHALIFKTGYASNVCTQNSLVSMYARCGKIDEAKRVFSSMGEHDLISWNSVLSGCAHHGFGKEAVEMFEQMRRTAVKPDLTTFLAVLSACSHVGLLDKGLEYFDLMRNDESVQPPRVEHYACIVDLYGRAGYLYEAEAFINSMPIEPGPSVFKALLSACQVHGNQEIAVRCARKLVKLCPSDPATYVLLSNVLAIGGYWNDAAGVREDMYDRGVMKNPGYSWV
ncbi:hypothetical protein LguiA_020924 [Lonicera macranthoides]